MAESTNNPGLSKEVLTAALGRILSSEEFERAERLQAFLRFVVGEQLAGRGEALKEYVVGVEVYGKADFDSRADASVRVGATKLRNRLERYYDGSGKEDPVIISIPKGSYVPMFQERTAAPIVAPVEMEARTSAEIATPHRTPYWYGALVIGLTAVAIIGWGFRKPSALPEELPKIIQVTTDPGEETHPAFSPDGSQVAYAAETAEIGNSDIYIRSVETGNTLRLTSDAARDSHPAWSPDGKTIAFIRNEGYGGAVYLIPSTGGPEKKLGNVNLGGLAWTADSEYVAARHRGSQLENPYQLLIHARTGETKPLTRVKGFEDYDAAFAPDGKRVAIGRCTGSQCSVYLGILRPDHTVQEPAQRLTQIPGMIHGLADG
jgi:dipeptidyl aminopeptidase/acylaminoacyl peptidase